MKKIDKEQIGHKKTPQSLTNGAYLTLKLPNTSLYGHYVRKVTKILIFFKNYYIILIIKHIFSNQ